MKNNQQLQIVDSTFFRNTYINLLKNTTFNIFYKLFQHLKILDSIIIKTEINFFFQYIFSAGSGGGRKQERRWRRAAAGAEGQQARHGGGEEQARRWRGSRGVCTRSKAKAARAECGE